MARSYTIDDFIKLNPNYRKGYDPKTRTASVSNTRTGKNISFGLGQGQQYGLGGLQDNSHTIADLPTFLSSLGSSQSKYDSPYADKITSTLAAIQGRPSFSYDPSRDVGLQTAQGSAMDAVSRSAARRNMLYSDSNKSQMGKSALELVPQFEQTAFNRYSQQGQSMTDTLRLLQDLEKNAYGQYRDVVGDTQTERQLGMQEGGLTGTYQGQPTLAAQGQQFSQGMAEQQFSYQQARDAIADDRYRNEFDFDVQKWGLEFALSKAIQQGQLDISRMNAQTGRMGAQTSQGQLQESIRSNKAGEGLAAAKMALDNGANQKTADYIGAIADYGTREEALAEFNKYKKKMELEGANINLIIAEIDRIFPPPALPALPPRSGTGGDMPYFAPSNPTWGGMNNGRKLSPAGIPKG